MNGNGDGIALCAWYGAYNRGWQYPYSVLVSIEVAARSTPQACVHALVAPCASRRQKPRNATQTGSSRRYYLEDAHSKPAVTPLGRAEQAKKEMTDTRDRKKESISTQTKDWWFGRQRRGQTHTVLHHT